MIIIELLNTKYTLISYQQIEIGSFTLCAYMKLIQTSLSKRN